MKRKTIFLIIAMGIFIIGVPLIIDWLVIGNSVPSNIANQDWVNFFGSYVGALVGGAISLMGISWTIRFTRAENKADRELQIRPVFDIYGHHLFGVKENWLGYVSLSIRGEDGEEYVDSGKALLRIRNSGAGPALNIDFNPSIVGMDEDLDYKVLFNNQNELVTTRSLMPGEQADLEINVSIRRNVLSRQEFESGDRLAALQKVLPSNNNMVLEISYDDLLTNHFTQIVRLSINYSLSFDKTGKGKITCNINLGELDAPKMSNK